MKTLNINTKEVLIYLFNFLKEKSQNISNFGTQDSSPTSNFKTQRAVPDINIQNRNKNTKNETIIVANNSNKAMSMSPVGKNSDINQ